PAREAISRRGELTSRRDPMRESLAGARDRVSQITYKIDSLRTLLASLEAQDEDVRLAILELIPNAAPAAQSVQAAQGFEAALDTLLRDVSKATVVDDAATALEAIKRLRERGAGRKTAGAAPGVFSVKRQLTDLESLLGSEETRVTGIAADLQTVEEELRAADDARILAEDRARSAEVALRDQRGDREHAMLELDRFERELAVTSEEQALYAEEKQQLVSRRDGAVGELQRLQQHERDTHEHIRVHEEQLGIARAQF